jgi:hypothetical protein
MHWSQFTLGIRLASLVIFWDVGLAALKAAEWTKVPLSQVDGKTTPLMLSSDGKRFAYPASTGKPLVAMPDGFVPQARLALDNKRSLVIGRQALLGDLVALVLTDKAASPLKIDARFARSLYYFHGFKAFDTPFLLAYDVEETMPSRRSSKIVKDGVDLFRLDVAEGELQLEKIADKLAISGMDARYRDQRVGNEHLLCAQAACVVISKDKTGSFSHKELRRPEWSPRSLIELYSGRNELRGLFRLDFDDRFKSPPEDTEIIYADCGIWPEGGCKDVPVGKIPTGFTADGTLKFLNACSDVEALLRKDILGMPGHGLTFTGMNNHEGRIPWGQVYVLDGMLDVIERLALPQGQFDRLRQEMRQRIVIELAWWMGLLQTEKPWLWSRRYSLERADIVSAVHLGRMTRVAGRAQKAGIKIPADLLHSLIGIMTKLDQTLEEIKGQRLTIRRGVPFYLDGSNTPWNYQSGWIEGLAALSKLVPPDGQIETVAQAMVRDFIQIEVEQKRPNLWQYCTGPCYDGWKESEGVSVNTPDWEGNKTRTSTAHVSYRTMDARAVLEAKAAWKMDGLEWFPEYAKGLVERGWLYPMLGAPLTQFNMQPKLSQSSIAVYGRAAIPFDLHNQVWAMNGVVANLGGCK